MTNHSHSIVAKTTLEHYAITRWRCITCYKGMCRRDMNTGDPIVSRADLPWTGMRGGTDAWFATHSRQTEGRLEIGRHPGGGHHHGQCAGYKINWMWKCCLTAWIMLNTPESIFKLDKFKKDVKIILFNIHTTKILLKYCKLNIKIFFWKKKKN